MRHRSLTDRQGVIWTVSEITKGIPTFAESRERRESPRSGKRPTPVSRVQDGRQLDTPWLCFESPRERRRIEDVPPNWDELDLDELEDLLIRSKPFTGPVSPAADAE